MSRRATSISRTAPRAQGITSVVSTARIPSSWQTATSSAFTPVLSAAVSSEVADSHQHLRLGMPPPHLGVRSIDAVNP